MTITHKGYTVEMEKSEDKKNVVLTITPPPRHLSIYPPSPVGDTALWETFARDLIDDLDCRMRKAAGEE